MIIQNVFLMLEKVRLLLKLELQKTIDSSTSAIKLELMGQITNMRATFHFGASISPQM